MKNQKMTVDFGQQDGIPLFKKFALFNSGIVTVERHERDMDLIDALKAESLRIDLFMGHDKMPYGNLVTGTADEPIFALEPVERWARALLNHGVLPYMAWCYFPEPLQIGGDWRSGPVDLEAWRKLLSKLARHFSDLGIPLRYQEVYNEPDCHDVFYTGTWEDYLQLYKFGSLGIKEGNPDAMIGGPSAAFVKKNDITSESLETFLDFVEKEDLQIDFFSYHSYGYEFKEYLHRTKIVREKLKFKNRFDTVELHLNELNIIPFPWDKEPTPLNSHELVPHVLDCIMELLDETDITVVHWAQFLNSSVDHLGIVDTEGLVKPLYHALAMYADMPIERFLVSSDPGAINAIASADESRACLLLWNSGLEPRTVTTELKHFSHYVGQPVFYTINENSYGCKEWIEARNVLFTGDTLSVVIGAKEILYAVFPTPEPIADIKVIAPGTIIRKRHYFPDRGRLSYAYFAEPDWTVWLGNGGEKEALSLVAFEGESFQPVLNIQANLSGWDTTTTLPSMLCIRIDYRSNGQYMRSAQWMLVQSDSLNNDNSFQIPWGTERQPDLLIDAGDLTFNIPISSYAPSDWDGRAIVSFVLLNGGEQAKAKIIISGNE